MAALKPLRLLLIFVLICSYYGLDNKDEIALTVRPPIGIVVSFRIGSRAVCIKLTHGVGEKHFREIIEWDIGRTWISISIFQRLIISKLLRFSKSFQLKYLEDRYNNKGNNVERNQTIAMLLAWYFLLYFFYAALYSSNFRCWIGY